MSEQDEATRDAAIELLPCPFCGSEAQFCEYYDADDYLDETGQAWIYVDCTQCPVKTYYQLNEADAAKVWNTRFDAGAAHARAAAVEEFVRRLKPHLRIAETKWLEIVKAEIKEAKGDE